MTRGERRKKTNGEIVNGQNTEQWISLFLVSKILHPQPSAGRMPAMEPSERTSSGEWTSSHHDTVRGGGKVSEIEEVGENAKEVNTPSLNNIGLPLASVKEDIDGISLRSYGSRSSEDRVYVGVGKSESSMDALTWTLKHAVEPGRSTTVYLVHVFPETRFVPSPCKSAFTTHVLASPPFRPA